MGTKLRALSGLSVIASLGMLLSCSSTADTPPGASGTGFLFVATQGDQKISSFKIDFATGKPTANGDGVGTGTLPVSVVLTPNGTSLFVANRTSNDISRYQIGSDGKLTSAGSSQTTIVHDAGLMADTGLNPLSMAVPASGDLLFVLTQGDMFPASGPQIPSLLEVFAVGSNAALSLSSSTAVGEDAVAVAVTPDGKYVYVANRTDAQVVGYAVGGGGALTPVFGSPFTAGTAPAGLAISPDGNFLYVANSGSDSVSVFAICDNAAPGCLAPTGELTEITNSPFSAGVEPVSIAIMPSGKFLYVVDKGSNQVSGFVVATVSGALTATSPPAISTGSTPLSIAAISASDTAQFLYVANNGGSTISPLKINTDTGNIGTAGPPVTTGGQPSAVGTR
jgi:6-phosphogluconolactonase